MSQHEAIERARDLAVARGLTYVVYQGPNPHWWVSTSWAFWRRYVEHTLKPTARYDLLYVAPDGMIYTHTTVPVTGL